MSDGSLLSNETRNRFRAIVQPYAAGLARIGLTPNMLTLIGFGIAVGAAILAGLESWFWAGIVSVVAGSFDMLDGAVARATGTTSKFGAFMDSTFDRWGEGVIYVGIVAGAAAAGSQPTALLAALAAVCAFMVSYTRAKAEGLGFSGEVGIAPRPERIVILGVGLVAAGLSGGPGASIWLQLALGAIVVLTTITVIQRILHVRRQAAQAASNDQQRGTESA
jgi:CDP-diacylglycerol--glycerol-3-phosphate 3-phosphatidyltransferase